MNSNQNLSPLRPAGSHHPSRKFASISSEVGWEGWQAVAAIRTKRFPSYMSPKLQHQFQFLIGRLARRCCSALGLSFTLRKIMPEFAFWIARRARDRKQDSIDWTVSTRGMTRPSAVSLQRHRDSKAFPFPICIFKSGLSYLVLESCF